MKNDLYLSDTVVLDPEWLSQAFMQLIQHEPTREAGGLLDHQHLKDVWQNHEDDRWLEYTVDEFYRLMPMLRQQRVALPTRGSQGKRSLIPQLLPTTYPSLPWAGPDDLPLSAKVIRIKTSLSPDVDGLMPQLIALLEPYQKRISRAKPRLDPLVERTRRVVVK